ncbi:CoA ester lyase [Paraburkholderia sp. LEh10]|uniref:HpcH/HpaI aldolase/citrate lyase family protein n=1 Tax=Paraburkholderia sp. LEh10 TaxID=2821353 RepID=UPI001AE39138|nr:CoA ester lyase [Paraburkholderia sp. LEh10]MBP0594746.1 CoA ester lyase [Paraburkholderia sp. LEh10]
MSDIANKPLRSYLFVPGNRRERFDKAMSSGADAVILDLEDAVAPEDKDAARQAIAAWLSPQRPVLVRVNAAGTPWYEQDAQLGTLRGVAGIVLPKAGSAADVSDLVSRTKSGMPVYPLIETAKGMWNALDIASAPSVHQLMFGTLDFCADMGMEPDGEELNPFRGRLTMISRVAGIRAPIDGVTPSIDDEALLKAETIKGKRWGFAGKLCIHPRQVATVNGCYAPSDTELAWARRVLVAFANANGAAVAVDGKMVDRPVVSRAQSIVDAART